MAKSNFFLLCENFITTPDGKATIVNIFDALNAPSFPVIAGQFTLAFNVRLEDEDIQGGKVALKVTVESSKGEQVVKAETEQEITTTESNVGAGIDMSGKIGFKEADKYVAKLYVNDKEISDYIFNVRPATLGSSKKGAKK